MGNCIKKESSTQWGGEDWDFISSSAVVVSRGADSELIGKEEKKTRKFSSTNSTTVTEIKIKITKNQLEELLGKVDLQKQQQQQQRGLTVHQILTQLIISGAGGYEIDHNVHRSWRPALQSIPEAEFY